MGVILDTSVLIAAEKGRLDLSALFAAHEGEPFCIAAITAAELLHGVERAKPAARKQSRSAFVEWVIGHVDTIDFDLAVARHHAGLWAATEAAGTPIGAYDLLIGATALHLDYPLATLNSAEFRRLPGLRLVEVGPFLVAE
jgi:predicted nucleic acid-binding protein